MLVFLSSFILGLLTPLTAVCVLPMYPGFISYVANNTKSKWSPLFFGLFVMLGVIVFMSLIGLIFVTLIQESLTKIIFIVSPIAFIVLGLISVVLIFNIKLNTRSFNIPNVKNTKLKSFFYGLFFGAIVLPCNPGFIAAFFATSILQTNPISSMLNFLFFGIGLSFPLVTLSAFAGLPVSQRSLKWLTQNTKLINKIAGSIMLIISVYYLLFVFFPIF